jgi:hypothetical protein
MSDIDIEKADGCGAKPTPAEDLRDMRERVDAQLADLCDVVEIVQAMAMSRRLPNGSTLASFGALAWLRFAVRLLALGSLWIARASNLAGEISPAAEVRRQSRARRRCSRSLIEELRERVKLEAEPTEVSNLVRSLEALESGDALGPVAILVAKSC